jgi:hypothetical protein
LLRCSVTNETWSNRISYPNQINPAQAELAEHVVVQVPDPCHGVVALDLAAIGRENIPESAAGVGEHG